MAPPYLVCPRCRKLAHGSELTTLANEARTAVAAGDLTAALGSWRRALELLPPGSRQHAVVLAEIQTLSRRVDGVAEPVGAAGADDPAVNRNQPQGARAGKGAAGLTGMALFLWKFKFVLGMLFTQGKLLLLGFTKIGTLLSMLVSLGVYWAAFGYKFAIGVLLSIYVHEMGHVSALRRFGIAANAPMFIPGFGAVVRLKQYPVDPREDSRVGLAGPRWGLAAAVVAFLVASAMSWPSWLAIARTGAWINLFNLIPVWQLDGSRGFRAMSSPQRWWAAAIIGAAWFATRESMLILLLIGAVVRAFARDAPASGDRRAIVEYGVLVAALSALCLIPVPR